MIIIQVHDHKSLLRYTNLAQLNYFYLIKKNISVNVCSTYPRKCISGHFLKKYCVKLETIH